jgi:hypothetical protein
MSKTGWIVAAAIALGGTVYVTRSKLDDAPAPDTKLAEQFGDLCTIARDNVDEPVGGVRQLGRYLAQNTGQMLANLGDTITLIERISDDDEHDQRAYVARDRIWRPWMDCAEDWERFGDAIEESEEASALLTTTLDRLDRTLGIIFSGRQVDIRRLPALLLERLPTGSKTSR